MKNYLIVLTSLAGLAGLALLAPSSIAGQTEPTPLFPLTIEEQRAMAEDAAAAERRWEQMQEIDVGPIAAPERAELAAEPQRMPAASQN